MNEQILNKIKFHFFLNFNSLNNSHGGEWKDDSLSPLLLLGAVWFPLSDSTLSVDPNFGGMTYFEQT